MSALVKYAAQTTEERQLQLLPRLLSYIRHLAVYEWEPVTLSRGPPPSDAITFALVAGLLEISYKCPSEYDRITSALWRYAETLMQQISDSGKSIVYILYMRHTDRLTVCLFQWTSPWHLSFHLWLVYRGPCSSVHTYIRPTNS